jgi:CRP/FNR family cyclic AMP-dependent transcriptional regulator
VGTSPPSRLQQKRAYLRKQELFRDLTPEEIEGLDHQTRMVTCPKGRILYSQDDQAETLFLLKRGRVQVYRLTPSGKRLELATIEPDTFFGEMPLLGESLRHTFAEAVEDALVCVMSRADVERLICDHPKVALHMIEVLSRRLAESSARQEELAYRSVPTRISAVLLRLSQEGAYEVVKITHQELADMIGALRETVTETLGELQAAGLVELQRGRIHLKNLAGLRSQMEEE